MKLSSDLRLSMFSWLAVPLVAAWTVSTFWVQLVSTKGMLMTTPTQNEAVVPVTAVVQPTETAQNAFIWSGTGLVSLWFDDAWETQYTETLPVMEPYGFRGALAVPTRLVGFEAYLNWYQIRRMQFKGWEITAHTRTHVCDWLNKSNDETRSEIAGSGEDLRAAGYVADQYVPPCGVYQPVMEEIKAQFGSSRTVSSGINALPVFDRYALKSVTMGRTTTKEEVQDWLVRARQQKGWLILVFHQIGTEDALRPLDNHEEPYSVSRDQFEEFMKLVKESNLPVVVPQEALGI